MTSIEHGTIGANGIQIHYAAQGKGPLVLLCHGFPESWYSWRHQLPALADAGYRAVALDMRGYGGTSKPQAIGAYNLSNLVGDVVGAVSALGAEQAVVVGHDWGAPVAWYSALMRPDVMRAVAVLSVPYMQPFPLPDGLTLGQVMAGAAGDREYYRLYFQEPGLAEAELEEDVRRTVLSLLYTASGDIIRDGVHPQGMDGHFPKGQRFIDQMVVPQRPPAWLTDADVDFYAKELGAAGFRGGLNWYRNIDAIPSILAPFIGARLKQPALYLYGEHDLIAGNTPDALAQMEAALPDLRGVVRCEGAGHWLQQERPEEVNRALLQFIGSL
jgi:pimeloyl-ACP methyl ester carboxylesterase